MSQAELTTRNRIGQANTCGACKRQIVWLTTINGKKVPTEPQLRLIITEAGEYVKGREAHFAYCPGASRFRKDKK